MISILFKNQSFKNEPSKRLQEYFYRKIKDKEINDKQFFEDFGMSYGNPMQFFSGLRYGDRGVTVEHIEIAQKKYGVLLDYIFGTSDIANSKGEAVIIEDPDLMYTADSRKTIGEKFRDIFEDHKTNIQDYAEQRLKITEQNLYKILRGEGW